MKFDDAGSNVQRVSGESVDRSQGAARAISVRPRLLSGAEHRFLRTQSFIDPGLCWDDIEWFKSITKSAFSL